MAANPIDKRDISKKDAFDDLLKGAKDSKVAIDSLTEGLKDLGEQQKKNIEILKKAPDTVKKSKDVAKAVKEVDETVDALNQTREAGIAIDKKILQAEKKLAESRSSRIKDLDIIRLRTQEQNKANKEAAKNSLGLVSAYQKESKRLNDLRNDYKDLAIQNKANTAEGKKLLKNIVTLDKKLKDLDDSVGQNFRSVGKYEKALKGLNSIIGKLGALALITKGVELLGDAFGDSREGVLAMRKTLANFTETAQVLIRNVINSWDGFVSIIRGGITLITVQMQHVESLSRLVAKGLLNIQLAAAKVDLAASFKTDAIDSAEATIKGINDQLEILAEKERLATENSVTFSEGFDLIVEGGKKIASAFKDTGDTVVKAVKGQKEFLELQLRLNVAIQQQERNLAGLAEQRQILQDISDDDTLGFVTRAKAVKEAEKAAIKFAETEEKLARTKETLAIEAVKQDLRRENALTNAQLDRIQTGEQLNAALTKRLSAFKELEKGVENVLIGQKISDANDEAFSAAFVERRDKEVEALSFRRDQEEKFRKTARDDFEQELDILEEFAEKRVASNEKIIGSDKATLKERQKALRDNQKIEKDLLDTSIALIIEQGKASIDLRVDLTKAEKEKQKALLTTAAIQGILNEQDEQEIFNLIRNLDLGEIEEKRLKETLKIKKDIAEINKDSLEAEEEAARRTTELNQDILTQERFLNGQLEDLDAEQLDNEKIHLEERIKALKKDSIERLELEKELNELLIEESRKRAEEEEAQNKKRLDDALATVNKVVDITLSELQKINDLKNQALDDEISEAKESIKIQQGLAAAGNDNILAEEKARLAKLGLERKRELERQATQERNIALAQNFVNSLAAHSKDDPKGAFAKAAFETFAGGAFAKLIAGFYDGTEDTGTVNKPLDTKGGRLAVLHNNERVMTAKQNAMVGSMTNPELADLAYNYQNGDLSPSHFKQLEVGNMMQQPNNVNLMPMITELSKQTDRLEKAFSEGQVAYEVHWNEHGEAVKKEVRKGVTKALTFKKSRI